MNILHICENYNILEVFRIVKIAIIVIKIAIPIILIVTLMFDFTEAIKNGEDDLNKTLKSSVKKFIAAALIFLIPTLINVICNFVDNNSNDVSYATCLSDATSANIEAAKTKKIEELIETARNNKDSASYYNALEVVYKLKNKNNKDEYIKELDKIKKEVDEKISEKEEERRKKDAEELEKYSNSFATDDNPNGKKILLLAGHSYSPYCEKCSDCRGYSSSGYAEEEETRIFVKKLEKALTNNGYSKDRVVIANELLGEDFDDHKTTKSFYVENCKGDNKIVKNISSKEYQYAIEIHFNAYNGSAKGPRVVYTDGKINNKEISE